MAESLENKIRRITEPAYFKCVLIPRAKRHQKHVVRCIRRRGKARLVFIVSSLPMWRFQPLLNLLLDDPRFEVTIVVFPFTNFSSSERVSTADGIITFFNTLNINCVNLCNEPKPGEILQEVANPDIIFYPQPYNHLFGNDLDCYSFDDRLLCYIPYASLTASGDWPYKTYLNQIAWRLFFPSIASKQEVATVLFNSGKNIRVVGEVIADLFSTPPSSDPWKKQTTPKKRIIWAPHYSIKDEGLLHRNSFIRLSEFMWEIATSYQDRIQIAFKPHPRLKTELYAMESWGKEKTDQYYARWENGDNTQLETGSYIDLFKTSDAMIHDSSSFTVEYHLTGNPVLFTSDDLKDVFARLNPFGQEAIQAHYKGNTEKEIVDFIESVVLRGEDPMKEVRETFYDSFLRPPAGKSVAENIYHEILIGLGFER